MRKGMTGEEGQDELEEGEYSSREQRRRKPARGVCSACGSSDIEFFDNGEGECYDCGHIFRWDRKPKRPTSRGRRRRPSFDDEPKDRRSRDRYELKIGHPDISGQEVAGGDDRVEVEEYEDDEDSTSGVGISFDARRRLDQRISKVEESVVKVENRLQDVTSTTEIIAGDIAGIKDSVERMEDGLHEMEEIKDGYQKVESTVRELYSLYDLVSIHLNPFVDTSTVVSDDDVTWDEEEDLPSIKVDEDFIDYEDELEEPSQPSPEPIHPIASELEEQLEHEIEDLPSIPTEGPRVPDLASPATVDESKRGYIAEMWILKWTEFLLNKVDHVKIPDLLSYYRRLGWIEGKVEDKVTSYLQGSMAHKRPRKEYEFEGDMLITADGQSVPDEDLWKLSLEDHSTSLQFIEKIYGKPSADLMRGAELGSIHQEADKLREEKVESKPSWQDGGSDKWD